MVSPTPQGENNAEAVLKYLNLVSDAEFTAYLKRKLVEWYAAAPKNDHRSPPREEVDGGEGGEGGCGTGEQRSHLIRTGAQQNRIGPGAVAGPHLNRPWHACGSIRKRIGHLRQDLRYRRHGISYGISHDCYTLYDFMI